MIQVLDGRSTFHRMHMQNRVSSSLNGLLAHLQQLRLGEGPIFLNSWERSVYDVLLSFWGAGNPTPFVASVNFSIIYVMGVQIIMIKRVCGLSG